MNSEAARAAAPPPAADTPERRALIAAEQLRMVLSHTRAATLVATVFAILLALNVHGTVSLPVVYGWIAIKVAVAVVRIAMAQAFRASDRQSRAVWRRRTDILLFVDGVVWGLAGARMMADSGATAALFGAVLACVSCVATFGLQVRAVSTAAYVVPILLPTAVGLMARGDDFGAVGGLGLLVILGLQIFTAWGAQQRHAAGIAARLDAQALVIEKDAALQLARRQSAVKTQFLANISHELRTPLHGILGLARLLHLEVGESTQRRRVELIESSGTHLLGLINDLLDVSRIETGRFPIRNVRFDAVAQVEMVADVYAVRAGDKGLAFLIDVRIDRPCWVIGDAARFRQVLHNLLGNALKFTAHGRIELSIARGDAPDMLRVQVRDTGRGIDADEQSRIFEAFRQSAPDPAHPTDGAGLGLTIAREIAQAMGGDITVESRLGQGSTFVFEARLPASAPAHGADNATAPGGADAATLAHAGLHHVLVAEDDDVNAIIVSAYLERLGIRAERVANGREAVIHALREVDRPELVLMDCRMPVMDGLAATRAIRSQEQTLGFERLPVIALTATSSDFERQQCIGAGMDDFVSKPFTDAELGAVLGRWGAAPQDTAPPAR